MNSYQNIGMFASRAARGADEDDYDDDVDGGGGHDEDDNVDADDDACEIIAIGRLEGLNVDQIMKRSKTSMMMLKCELMRT